MMVPTTPLRAWDWGSNTLEGVVLFVVDKLSRSHRRVAQFRAQRPLLRNLTPAEHEDNALVYYGPHAGGGPYWVPRTDGLEWIRNTAGNPGGVDYADDVRRDMK